MDMGLSGLEPPTSRLSGVRSNQLSYEPSVENTRFELVTSCLQGRRSPNWANPPRESGSHLLSHAVSSIVPSAAQVLTIVFGMGTGVSPERIATGNTVSSFHLITE